MTPEQRLKQALSDAASDPGVKQDWASFLQTARRDRFAYRARMVAVAGVLIAAGTVVATFGGDLFDQALPEPANRRQQDRILEEKVERAEERVRNTRELVEDALIAPGPGGGAPLQERRARDVAATADQRRRDLRAERTADKQEPKTGECRGEAATIVGTAKDDVLEGTSGRDVIAGLGGDDRIRGGAGGDYICGHDGIDHLYGDDGRDSLVGGPGDDYTAGGEAFDFLHFPTASTPVAINLQENFAKGDGRDVIASIEGAAGTEGNDDFMGDDEANLFSGGGGHDTMNGFGGNDHFFPGPGDDAYGGHTGSDTVSFTGSGVRVDLANDRANGEGFDFIGQVENVNGTPGNDFISGDDRNNTLWGGLGSDTISGGAGSDVLIGVFGDDTLDGGIGTDVLDGGEGRDTCTSGEEKTSCETSGPVGAAVVTGLIALVRRWGRRRK